MCRGLVRLLSCWLSFSKQNEVLHWAPRFSKVNQMTFSKKSFFIIGCVGLLVLIYFFLRGTTPQDIVKVYKHTPVSKRAEVKGVTDVSSDTSTSAKSAKYVHQKSIGEMQHLHSHPHEAPSATFIVSLRERVGQGTQT